MSPSPPDLLSPLAVYGSLRPLYPTLDTLGLRLRLRWIGSALLDGTLLDLGEYPGLVPGPGSVRADLMLPLDPDVIRILDDYEAWYPDRPEASYFERLWTPLKDPQGQLAWVYHMRRSAPPVLGTVPHGDWSLWRPPSTPVAGR
jgi:gamma-glutamylcyclotransferase (GGCT)/AIG2-like uncharacterized protein YtfP